MLGIFCLGTPERTQGGNEHNALRSPSTGKERIGIQLGPPLWRSSPSLLRLASPNQGRHPPDTDPAQAQSRALQRSYGSRPRRPQRSLETLGKRNTPSLGPSPKTGLDTRHPPHPTQQATGRPLHRHVG